MVASRNTVNRIYNTGEKTRKEIEQEFIVRQHEFGTIMEDIRTSTMEFPEQEYLIIGEKGMGKTMLLTKIKYEIENDNKLKKWLIPIAFPEELNGASELYDLWLRVAEYLEELNQFSFFKNLRSEIITTHGEEAAAFAVLNQALKTNEKKIILLIDNFGTFLNELDAKEDHRLREILITNPNLRIIAANPEMVNEVHRYDKTFYEHFIEIKLKGLEVEETKKLMLNLGEIYGRAEDIKEIITNEPYRIHALRDFTGGNIRNIVMLFNILLNDKNGEPFNDLIQILDDVTPLNLNRVAQLKKNQRKIIDYIALQWDAVYTADIAKALRMKSNEVSAQLNHLADNQWIISKGIGRKKLYQLRDRFFNIWYLMRNGRKQHKERIKQLVHFYKIKHQENNSLAMQVNEADDNAYGIISRAIIHVKSNEIEDAIKLAEKCLYNKNYLEKNEDKILSYLMALLGKGQTHVVFNYFSDEKTGLKDRFKPLWYATIYLKEGTQSNEFLKMGEEIQELVSGLLEEISNDRLR